MEERLHGLEEEARQQARQHRQDMAEFHRLHLANESSWMQDIDQGRQLIKKWERLNAEQAKHIMDQQERATARKPLFAYAKSRRSEAKGMTNAVTRM
ncbi:MAG: hypothetical protein HYV16_01820 [Gammaproteobacteria bacterium]|nr:hypothetical protein [Gammaproteobacteria bacterium]